MADVSAPTLLTAAVQHARQMYERGDALGARATLERAVGSAASALGADHPEVLMAARALAGLHREVGDLAEARRTLEGALAAGQRIHGDDHPVLLALAYDLGQVADEYGNRHEARRNFAIVARHGAAVFGPDDPRVRAATAYASAYATADTGATAHTEAAARGQPAQVTTYQPVPAPTPPRAWVADRPRRRGTPAIVAIVAAVAVVAGVTTAVAVLRPRTVSPPHQGPTTTSGPPARPAPTGVRLVDDGATITVLWNDPASGNVPFIVSGARAGEQARAFATLPAGRTSYTVSGLNPRLQYCFTVAAVYATDHFALSDLVCTTRPSNPQPTPSRR